MPPLKVKGTWKGAFTQRLMCSTCQTEEFSTAEFEMPTPKRRAFSAVQVQDEVILVGGISEGARYFSLLDNVTALNLTTGQSRELPPLPTPNFAPAVGYTALANPETNSQAGQLIVFGGLNGDAEDNYEYIRDVIALDLSEEQPRWLNANLKLMEPRGFAQVLSGPDQKIWVFGGHTVEDGVDRPSDRVEAFILSEESRVVEFPKR